MMLRLPLLVAIFNSFYRRKRALVLFLLATAKMMASGHEMMSRQSRRSRRAAASFTRVAFAFDITGNAAPAPLAFCRDDYMLGRDADALPRSFFTPLRAFATSAFTRKISHHIHFDIFFAVPRRRCRML